MLRAPALRFHLLGHVRASLDGQPFRLTSRRKTLPLLAYLLLHRGATLSRGFLAFLLWPDDDEETARGNFRATLHDLLKFLPQAETSLPWITVEGTSICWNADAPASLDVDDFETALRESDLKRAVDLYGGDLLEGLYEEWLILPRERLRGAYLGALSQLVSQTRRRVDYVDAIGYARLLLKADPLNEDVARRLVALRYEAGDRAGALEEYELLAQRLRSELGIDPMPETAMLRDAIAQNRPLPPGERPSDGELSAPVRASSRSSLPFVGREDELDRLLDAWSRAVRGRGGLAFIEGAPGLGKTRLMAELSHAVEERGGRVLSGRTGFPEAIPYQAFLEALRGALPLILAAQLDDVTLSALATLLPELEHLVKGLKPLRTLAPDSERDRTLSALAAAFTAISQPRALLLVLEDLHSGQAATIAALALLARRASLTHVLVAVTYREGDLPRWHPLRAVRAEALRSSWGYGITLQPLSVVEVSKIAKDVASPLADSSDELHTACAGNPLLLAQFLSGPQQDLSHGRALQIDTLVGAQMDRLSERSRAFVEIAALVGTRFSRSIVREAGGWDEASASEALDELLDRNLVAEAAGYGDFDYAFAHQLVRDVVAAQASERRAADRHRRIARALEALHAERVSEFASELARHYDLANDADNAATRYLLAARRALQMVALDESRANVRRGLELATDPTVRAELYVEACNLAQRSDDDAERSAAIEGLEAAAGALEDAELRRTAALFGVRFSLSGDPESQRIARDRLRQAVAGAGPRWRAELSICEAFAGIIGGDLIAAGAAAEAAVAAAREHGDPGTIARALTSLTQVLIDRGDYGGANAATSEAQELAFRAGDGVAELEALQAAHKLALEFEEVERAIVIGEQWLERARALGDRNAEAFASIRLAVSLLFGRRDLARARSELAKPLATYEELGSRRGIARLRISLGIFEAAVGDFAAAITSFEQALVDFEAMADVTAQVMLRSNLGLVRAFSGDPEGGYREASAALRLVREARIEYLEAASLENVAVTCAFRGDFESALRLGKEALAIYERVSPRKRYVRFQGDLAVWYARSGDLAQARACVERVLSVSTPRAFEFPQMCPWAVAQVLRACGETAAASEQLERAHDFVVTLAEALTEEERARFEDIVWNREILAAYRRNEWPDLGVRHAG